MVYFDTFNDSPLVQLAIVSEPSVNADVIRSLVGPYTLILLNTAQLYASAEKDDIVF